MYAILNISGKQFKALEGLKLRVPKQIGNEGDTLNFKEVLLIKNGTKTEIGNPNIDGASVTATILNHGREKKILVYKKKRRKGYQRKNGHRQEFTNLQFEKIHIPGSTKRNNKTKDVLTNESKSIQEEE